MKMAAIMILDSGSAFIVRYCDCRSFQFRGNPQSPTRVHTASAKFCMLSPRLQNNNGSGFRRLRGRTYSLISPKAFVMFIAVLAANTDIGSGRQPGKKEESTGHIRHLTDLYAAVCFLLIAVVVIGRRH